MAQARLTRESRVSTAQSARDRVSRVLRTGVIIIGCVYLLGAVAFAVVICMDYWEAGWSLDKGLASGVERALL